MPRRSPRAARLLIVSLIMTVAAVIPATTASAVDLFTDDFETGNLTKWDPSPTNFIVQSAIRNAGTFAGRATAPSGSAFATKTLASGQTDVYLRSFVNVVSHNGTIPLLRMSSATNSLVSLNVNTSDQLIVRNLIAAQTRQTGVTMPLGTFVELQLHLHIEGLNSFAEVWINGAKAGGIDGAWNFGTDPIGKVALGVQASGSTAALDVVFDDVVAATTMVGGGGGPEAPATPTGLATTAVAYNRVDLTWNASSGATGYTVRRDGSPVGTVGLTTFSDTTVAAETTYQYTVDASNTGGNSPQSDPITVTTPAAPSGSVVVMAAGDIACDPASGSFKAGNGTPSQCRAKYTAPLLEGADRVLALGDEQYECGGATAFAQSYDKSWGLPAIKNKTYPAVGDEEYATSGTGCGASGADGYFGYFGAVANGPNGYYSYDFGGWHFIVLNSECSKVGGCGDGSPQNRWLEADLAANTKACTIAYWHRPLYYSKAGSSMTSSATRPFWDDLFAAGAEIVLNGHSHWYERFAPQTPSGGASPNGIVEWIVGTGGKSHNTQALAAPGARHPRSVTANASTFGVLKLTLRAGSYDWRYVIEGTSSYSDSGTGSCH